MPRKAQRKIAARGAAHDADRLRAVVETAVDGIILIDEAGAIMLFNPACERLFGYQAGEVIGVNVKLLMPSIFRDGHDRYIDNYIVTGRKKIIGIGRQVHGMRKDGSVFPMDLSVGEYSEDGRRVFVGIIHDVTARSVAEARLEQAQKMEAIGQLSGGIAHDFNNLLTVIIGNAETLSLKLGGQSELRPLSDAIFAAGERGAELTRHLLAFGRRQVLQPVAIDCRDLLLELGWLLHRTLRDDVTLSSDMPSDLPWVLADRVQLESAILNLALNAQDAMPRGGLITVTGTVAALNVDGVVADDYVAIAMTDTGEGMAPEVAQRAFEPFFTTKGFGKGSGLGLSMVYGFARQSNGHVSIESTQGAGTTVTIFLPIARGDAALARDTRGASPEVAPKGHETILVVEDDPHVRVYVVGLLGRLGYTVYAAENSDQALRHLSEGVHADLLFTDIVMPGMSGSELARRARELRPTLRILYTSGYPIDSLEADAGVLGESDILLKPYRKSDLAHRLRQALDPSAQSQ
jgi:PAS domain S-box-containing protein